MHFILTADWHLRGDRPRCRTDEDWLQTQTGAMLQVVNLANAKKLPIFIVGDIFNTARVATEVVVQCVQTLKKAKFGVFILAGNHDLPYHSYDNVNSSSYGLLREHFPEICSNAQVNGNSFGLDDLKDSRPIVFTHQLVFENDAARPMEKCGKIPQDLANEFSFAQWIFTGDYHHAFHEIVHNETSGHEVHVVNPGCLIRQVADMKEYAPLVYEVNTESGKVTPHFLVDEVELIQDAYLRNAEEKEDRLDAFLNSVAARGTVTLSFRDNLAKKMTKDVGAPIIKEILQILEQLNKEK